jgi:hypothetical protein
VEREIDLEKQASLLTAASSAIEFLMEKGTTKDEAIKRITSINPFNADIVKSLILKEWDK